MQIAIFHPFILMSHYPSQGASGRPATDVNILTIPATIAEDKTIRQSIADKTVLVPITATAVCAIVLTARMPALTIHFLVFTESLNTQFLNIHFPSCHIIMEEKYVGYKIEPIVHFSLLLTRKSGFHMETASMQLTGLEPVPS
jgi:hypothetical protein